jgi:hypothetical protein
MYRHHDDGTLAEDRDSDTDAPYSLLDMSKYPWI